jgi:hypothetical protein
MNSTGFWSPAFSLTVGQIGLTWSMPTLSFLTEAVLYFGRADSMVSGIHAIRCALFGIVPTKHDILGRVISLGLNLG